MCRENHRELASELRFLPFLALLLMAAAPIGADEMEDVVYLKNGSVIRGMIVSQVPNRELTIETADGNRFVFAFDEISRIAKEPAAGRRSRRVSGEREIESWYTMWGLGTASMSYPDEIDEVLDFIDGLPGVDRTTITLDLLGIYFPTAGGSTLVGGIINGFGDRFEFGGEWFQLNGVTYSLSAVHFPQRTIGRGPFIRGDFGISRLDVDSSDYGSDSSDWGSGILFGGGLAYPITEGTSLALTVSYAVRRIDGDTAGTFSAALTGLF